MSTSCIEPKGNTFSLENPRRWVLTGSSFSLLIPILSKAEAKMMSAKLLLSTRTRWTVLLADYCPKSAILNPNYYRF